MRDFRAISLNSFVHIIERGADGVAFVVKLPSAPTGLRVIASIGGGWDHVSVSHAERIPTWQEMERIKRLFFREDETAMQIHVPPADHVNNHPNVLHLWRPQNCDIPRPPVAFV